MKDKFEFSDKLALIVGGSSGIGKAVAEALLKSQAQVIIVGRKIDKLNKTAQELADYGNVEVLQADITNKQDVAKLIARIAEQMPDIEYLVNAAGIFSPKPFLDCQEIDYDSYLEINRGTFFLTQQVAKNFILL